MRKSADAFRTISEVAQDLDLPQHVLRFWETRFSQIKPMKRGGGRRYYRPDDIDLLRGIRYLLYDQGYTIKGVQKILKEQGVRFVMDSVNDTDMADDSVMSAITAEPDGVGDLAEGGGNQPDEAKSLRAVAAAANADTANLDLQSNSPTALIGQDAQRGLFTSSNEAPPVASDKGKVADDEVQAKKVLDPEEIPVKSNTVAFRPVSRAREAVASHGNTSRVVSRSSGALPQSAPATHAAEASYVTQSTQATMELPLDEIRHQQHQVQSEHPVELRHEMLLEGGPKFLHGESAAMSIGESHEKSIVDDQKGGIFKRLRSSGADHSEQGLEAAATERLDKDDVRRLQSTLFELLECKRILDSARGD